VSKITEMLEKLKIDVCKANLELVEKKLIIHTWGNVSGRDKETGLIVIKPSGVKYDKMKPEDMVVIDQQGQVKEGNYRPSTDAPTHLILYEAFESLRGIVHTHSSFATSWAQSGRSIPPLGTTHADHFYGEVPCTRLLTQKETEHDYEINTGKIIIESIGDADPLNLPAVLVNGHGPFCWGTDAENAVYNAVALEEVAKMAFYTVLLGKSKSISQFILDKHFKRKHGKDAYYGQDNDNI
jgi:L-ribulose-5-phosphate 4-epimerase